MKIKARPGEFWFKALIPEVYEYGTKTTFGYKLSEKFYSSEEAAKEDNKYAVWPAEMIDRQCVYVPTKEEMEEDF